MVNSDNLQDNTRPITINIRVPIISTQVSIVLPAITIVQVIIRRIIFHHQEAILIVATCGIEAQDKVTPCLLFFLLSYSGYPSSLIRENSSAKNTFLYHCSCASFLCANSSAICFPLLLSTMLINLLFYKYFVNCVFSHTLSKRSFFNVLFYLL